MYNWIFLISYIMRTANAFDQALETATPLESKQNWFLGGLYLAQHRQHHIRAVLIRCF